MIVRTQKPGPEQGSALILSLVSMVVLVGFTGAILASSVASNREVGGAIERTRALYAAEAAVAYALGEIAQGKCPDMGKQGSCVSFGDGGYWGSAVQNVDNSWTVTSVGHSGGAKRAVEVVIAPVMGGIYDNAVFAGNAGGDTTYTMKFGGTGTSADKITGNVYSGNHVSFSGAATVDGVPRAKGKVTDWGKAILPDASGKPRTAETGAAQPIPDIAGMNYAVNNDVDVTKEFKAAKYASGTGGGKAWQLPATNPAHILRLNPSDRVANTSVTTKDDYFLEDPYMTLRTDSKSDGSDPFMINLTDPTKTKGGVEGNHKLYYVDGNLWVHNLSSMSLAFQGSGSTGVNVTFVVKGNIYISDNLFLKDKKKDGLALIALKDSAVKDSGNIYFGDPTFGTLEQMNAYMYAENNFYDNNLDATGSAKVTLNGNMTAGNLVSINRDYGKAHSKLTVNFDDRVSTKKITLPGLPKATATQSGLVIALWREIAVP